MDLNEPPSVDDEKGERMETAVEIMRREREERRTKMAARFFEEELKRKQSGGGGGGGGEASVVPHEPKTTPRILERPRNVGALPEGWIDCPGFGQPLANLIPSKVPLGDHFNEVIEAGKRYSSKQVVKQQRALGREVSLVIDLTNTTRYYSSWDWKNQGIKHVKVPCRGRDEVPDNESVNNFVFEVIHFFHSQRGPGSKYILVHCTHGHNRTGFMIIHYLKRTQGMPIEQAIQRFAEARPPGIYKQEYIESLFNFYNERRPVSLVCPATPEWKRICGVDLNGEANDADDDGENDGGIMAALQDAGLESEAIMTNDDVLGDAIPDLQQLEMQKLCYRGLGLSPPLNHGTLTFPGSQPVSLDRSNLQLLRQRYYYATWKADGTRYMMFITNEGCYLVDRKFQFRRVQLRFPNKNKAPSELHHLTLLDGEMIIDTVPETGQQKRRYLVYDLIMLNNEPLIKLPFHERWKRIQRDVIEPRLQEAPHIAYYNYDMEAFRVRRKDFWMLSATQKLLRDFIPKLSHEADGLILQGWDDPYVPRTHDGLLKWKYAHMNSVDFRFEVSPDGSHQKLFLIDKGRLQQLVGASVSFPEDQDSSSLSGKIIECAWHPDNQIWEFMRVRYDKEFPNAWNTYHKVMQSIRDNITEEDLLAEIQEILRLPMYQERIHQEQLAPRKPHAQLVKRR